MKLSKEVKRIHKMYGLSRKQSKESARLHGGFSEPLVCSPVFFKYAGNGHAFGYIGSSQRTKARDKVIETILRGYGLGDSAAASWLTSGTARHMMDNVERKTSIAEFEKRAKGYTSDAAIMVTIWNHPDHEGTSESTHKIEAHLRALFSNGKQ